MADSRTGQKSYWKIVNKLLNKCKVPRIPPLLIDNQFVLCCKEKATIFNDFFVEQCKPFETASLLPTFHFLTEARLDTLEISNDQISSILNCLQLNKAHGPDNISVNMVRLCGNELCVPLKLIFENILRTGKFPKQWKKANVTPVHKKDVKELVKNYRPISLLPIFAKVFEKIVFVNLYNHLTLNKLITVNQSGFRPHDSVTNQLTYLVHEIFQIFNQINSVEVRSVFLDMSKAFDKVGHERLLFKLQQNGVTGNLLKLLENYLSNREQRVALNGQFSEWGPIMSGVPQGSVLGPLLFLVYINDLENGIKSNIKFFADDTSLFSIVIDPKISADEINHDLHVISQWAFQWKMKFNPDPTKPAQEVLFSNKHADQNHPPLFFNNIEVKQVKEHKHLGLILDSKLSFRSHINEKLGIARKGVGVIKYLSSYVPLKTLDQIYKMYVRPHLDFCDIIYHIPEKINLFSHAVELTNLMAKIERVQFQAAVAVTGTWKTTSRNRIYDELGWETLSQRRWYRRLVQFFKIVKDPTSPDYLKGPIPPPHTHRLGLRSGNEFPLMGGRIDQYKNSFYPQALQSWNSLDPIIRQTVSLSKFKKDVLGLIRFPKKSIFNINDPKYLRRLFQLRVGLSPLKEHKKRKGFIDTPSDTCSCQMSAETTEHFLIHCGLYTIARHGMFQVINPLIALHGLEFQNELLANFLLYGDTALSLEENKATLTATLAFIKQSSRFEIENE